jgi:hypothetical protein
VIGCAVAAAARLALPLDQRLQAIAPPRRARVLVGGGAGRAGRRALVAAHRTGSPTRRTFSQASTTRAPPDLRDRLTSASTTGGSTTGASPSTASMRQPAARHRRGTYRLTWERTGPAPPVR